MNHLQPRTKKFALDVMLFSRKLPTGDEFIVLRQSLIRSATSLAAVCRASLRLEPTERTDKIIKAEEYAEEARLWLELLKELATRDHPELQRLDKEAGEIAAFLEEVRDKVC